MAQQLKDTDAMILIEFREAITELVKGPMTKEGQAEMARIGRPYLHRLLDNGNDMQTCAKLMRGIVALTALDAIASKVTH